MRLFNILLIVALPLMVLGCATTRPELEAMQSKQASTREDLLQLEGKVKKTAGRLEELEKRISFLEGNLTANLADLQRSVDKLNGKLDGQETETKRNLKALSDGVDAKLDAFSRDVKAKLSSVVAENKELLKAIEEARKSSFATGYEHVVESGETLGLIAKSYGVTVEAIMEANDLADPDTLKVGQLLFVPKQ